MPVMKKELPTLQKALESGEVVEIRGDGKAGSGLMMAMQTLGISLGHKNMHVHEWPLFSSARKGASVRSFMRVARQPIAINAAIVRPHLAVLVDEVVAEEIDFASGMKGGIYLVNTQRSAQETAEKYRLAGTTVTIDGDRLGEKHLGHRIGNVSLFAALTRISGIIARPEGKEFLADMLEKRRLPDFVQKANLACYDESFDSIDFVTVTGDDTWRHEVKPFEGFPFIPMGAQSELRTSLQNKTSRYRPTGLMLSFSDPSHKCTGCSLCLVNCPEDIITFVPDEKRGVRVTGANIVDFCKLCQECVEVCPVNLFTVHEVELT